MALSFTVWDRGDVMWPNRKWAPCWRWRPSRCRVRTTQRPTHTHSHWLCYWEHWSHYNSTMNEKSADNRMPLSRWVCSTHHSLSLFNSSLSLSVCSTHLSLSVQLISLSVCSTHLSLCLFHSSLSVCLDWIFCLSVWTTADLFPGSNYIPHNAQWSSGSRISSRQKLNCINCWECVELHLTSNYTTHSASRQQGFHRHGNRLLDCYWKWPWCGPSSHVLPLGYTRYFCPQENSFFTDVVFVRR